MNIVNKDDSFLLKTDIAKVLAWEEWMCVEGVTGVSYHLWTPQKPAIALGISQIPQRELNLTNVTESGCGIVRRPSGGGAVVLVDGVLAFGVFADPAIFSDKYAIHEAFDLLTRPVREAIVNVTGISANAVIAGISDLAVETGSGLRKVCGCAQMRKKRAVLVHGTILVDVDLAILEKYLAWPSEVPDYRQGRSHSDFCINLSELSTEHIEIKDVVDKIAYYANSVGWRKLLVPDELANDCQELFTDKYCKDMWNIERKRTIK